MFMVQPKPVEILSLMFRYKLLRRVDGIDENPGFFEICRFPLIHVRQKPALAFHLLPVIFRFGRCKISFF
jgi:hypothetical protein